MDEILKWMLPLVNVVVEEGGTEEEEEETGAGEEEPVALVEEEEIEEGIEEGIIVVEETGEEMPETTTPFFDPIAEIIMMADRPSQMWMGRNSWEEGMHVVIAA